MCEFKYIGWCHESNHDKIWAAVEIDGKYFAVWGRRGKALTFKRHSWFSTLLKVKLSKSKKGYNEVTTDNIDSIFPDFELEVQKQLMFAMMADSVK